MIAMGASQELSFRLISTSRLLRVSVGLVFTILIDVLFTIRAWHRRHYGPGPCLTIRVCTSVVLCGPFLWVLVPLRSVGRLLRLYLTSVQHGLASRPGGTRSGFGLRPPREPTTWAHTTHHATLLGITELIALRAERLEQYGVLESAPRLAQERLMTFERARSHNTLAEGM